MTSRTLPCSQPFHAFVYPICLRKLRRLAVAYAQRAAAVARIHLACKPPDVAGPPYAHPPRDLAIGGGGGAERLRLGYVSSDFVNHPLAHLVQVGDPPSTLPAPSELR